MAVAGAVTPRQRKARGSIELRSGIWYLRTRDAEGKRRRIELRNATDLRSEAAARRVADAWLARNQPHQLRAGESISFALYAEKFIEQHAALYRKSSRRHYTTIIRRHLVAELASLALWRIGAGEIREALARRRATGLRRPTLQGVRAVLLQLLRQARVDGYDAQEIAPLLVRLPRGDVAERERRHISPDELDQILAAAAMPWRALYAVMGLAGLRISEALGLAWSHLELAGDKPLLHVRQGASGGELLPLKTKTSRADLPLDGRLAQILAEYLEVWRPNDAGLLFAAKSGRPLDARDIRRYKWNPQLERLQIPHAGFHALRHGLPRRLFAAGCSASVVRQLMRHGSIAITERYTHTTAEDLRAAINAASESRKQPHPRPTVTQLQPAALENKP